MLQVQNAANVCISLTGIVGRIELMCTPGCASAMQETAGTMDICPKQKLIC